MFDKNFYPTPESLIKKMLQPYLGESWRKDTYIGLEGKTILEPSAGKGDILDFISNHLYRCEKPTFYAIEKNIELQAILKEKDYDIIGTDFLTFEDDLFYDFIIMNPPFDQGDKHLLKAIEISHDTEIICLLNAETLLNPHTRSRKLLLEKIKEYGSYEIIEQAFINAERRTNVKTALVRLKVVKEEAKFDFSFKDYEVPKIEFTEDFINNDIARKDTIGNVMLRFDDAKKSYVEYIEAKAKFEHFTSQITDADIEKLTKNNGSPESKYNYFCKAVKKRMWKEVITELKLERYMTAAVQNNFNKFINQQANLAFTRENVQDLFQMLMMNRGNILEQAITDVFDMLTANYYSENRLHVEGWKTNDRYKINRKVILPSVISYGNYYSAYDLKQYGDNFSHNYSYTEKYADIDRVLCYITGKKYEDIYTIKGALSLLFEAIGKVKTGDKFNNTTQSEFFDIKIFKKGTVHLTFRDKMIWDEFNMRACADKNWLPDQEKYQWEKAKEDRRRKRQNDRNGVLRVNEVNNEESRQLQFEAF